MSAAGVWFSNYDASFRRIYTKQDYVDSKFQMKTKYWEND